MEKQKINERLITAGGDERTLRGPVLMACGTPRRKRKVWIMGYGVGADDIAYGGGNCYRSYSEAISVWNSLKAEGGKLVEKRAARVVFEKYQALARGLTEKYRARINAADPRVGLESAFHLAHNWGNEAARRELDRYAKVYGALLRRDRREYHRARGF